MDGAGMYVEKCQYIVELMTKQYVLCAHDHGLHVILSISDSHDHGGVDD